MYMYMYMCMFTSAAVHSVARKVTPIWPWWGVRDLMHTFHLSILIGCGLQSQNLSQTFQLHVGIHTINAFPKINAMPTMAHC